MSAPPVTAEPDRALLRRMAGGDEAALGALYDRYAGLVHSVALRVTGDDGDAEEVVEEAFWQAWRQAGRYEDARGGIATWLMMIARSRALDRVRSRRRTREERWAEVPEPSSEPDDGETPLESAEAGEVRRIVRRVLAELPPEQRQTLEMAYFGGLSQSEIAERTGQPLGTVKTRARLGLRKLRDALAVLREDGR